MSLHPAPQPGSANTCDSEAVTLGAQVMMTGWEPVSSFR